MLKPGKVARPTTVDTEAVPEIAKRLATQLLKDNGHLVRFDVMISDQEHLLRVADSLRELGCTVQVDRLRGCLDVSCPESKQPNP